MKEAPRTWNIRFNEIIKEFDFSQNADEACVYKNDSGSVVVFLVLYVDDISIIGNDVSKIQSINILVIQEHSHERPLRNDLHIRDIDRVGCLVFHSLLT